MEEVIKNSKKLVCMLINNAEHAKEMNSKIPEYPVFFLSIYFNL
jgi:2-keto-4-pentenoate hydratase/2-oxohepta-3-ene-1,7-dioic acid hydratase in catechol pathway